MVEQILLKMVEYNGSDIKRINHAIKVYSYCCMIMADEAICEDEKEIIKIASILHDIGIHNCELKYGSSDGKLQEKEGPDVALQLLSSFFIKATILDRVLYLISKHHSYGEIEGLDFQILIEADFIVNSQEEGYTITQKNAISEKYFKTNRGKKLINM